DRGTLLLSLRRVLEAQRALPANVRALGWVSFANDVASELAYPIVPLFLRTTLGASYTIIGIIEGIAEGVAVGFRGLAGWLSDRGDERRKPWIAAGYGLTTASRPLLALAHGWGLVLTARLTDRAGKAARTAPRDALIRDSSPPHLLGSSFGYHRALDSAGAVLGPLAAVGLLSLLHVSLRTALLVVVLPSAVALGLVAAVRDVPPAARAELAPAGRLGRLAAPRGLRRVRRRDRRSRAGRRRRPRADRTRRHRLRRLLSCDRGGAPRRERLRRAALVEGLAERALLRRRGRGRDRARRPGRATGPRPSEDPARAHVAGADRRDLHHVAGVRRVD